MRKFVFITSLLFFTSCESVKFKEQVLYDKYEQPVAKEKSSQIVFDDGNGTMWNSLFDCGNFEINNKIAYSGKSSIKLDWNKEKCEWIGFGNSFNNWQPVDLSTDRYKKALSFYVRTQSKTAKAIPIVANLEDFGGGGSYYFIDANKYLFGLEMDTNWKQIIVPLWHFPINEEEVDITSIKQMKFQLEGAGSFYLDEIQLIDYSKEEYSRMREEVEKMRPKGNSNQQIYTKGNFKEDAWGQENNECQTLQEKSDDAGNTFIYWKFNSKDCSWAKWGINWNGWYAINFRGITEQSKIMFSIKASEATNFKVFIQDFKGNKVELFSSKSQNISPKDWTPIHIPLNSLNLKEKGIIMDQIKQLYFVGENSGEVQITTIKITDK